MNSPASAIQFTHVADKPGPARGMSITGKRRPAEGAAVAQDVPLIIAVHGGTYTSEYFAPLHPHDLGDIISRVLGGPIEVREIDADT